MDGAPALNHLTARTSGAAIEVHRHLGPGLLVPLSAIHRLDVVVAGVVVVDIKSVESLSPVHVAQTLAYLRLIDSPVGLLIDFNRPTAEGWHQASRRAPATRIASTDDLREFSAPPRLCGPPSRAASDLFTGPLRERHDRIDRDPLETLFLAIRPPHLGPHRARVAPQPEVHPQVVL